jgi:hypothetical protein
LEKAGLVNPDGSVAPLSGFLTSKLEEFRKELEIQQKEAEARRKLEEATKASSEQTGLRLLNSDYVD